MMGINRSHEEKKKEISKKGKKYIEETMPEYIGKLVDDIELNKEKYTNELLNIFDNTFEQCINKQKQGIKDAVSFINVNFLRSSIVTSSFDYIIQIYDATFLLDEEEVSGVWSPNWIKVYYDNVTSQIEKILSHEIIGISSADFFKFEMQMGEMYLKMALLLLNMAYEKILELESYKKMRKNDDIKILFGEIYGNLITIFSQKEEV